VFCFLVLGCQYQRNPLSGKTCLRNELLCVQWDIKVYTLTHIDPAVVVYLGSMVTTITLFMTSALIHKFSISVNLGCRHVLHWNNNYDCCDFDNSFTFLLVSGPNFVSISVLHFSCYLFIKWFLIWKSTFFLKTYL